MVLEKKEGKGRRFPRGIFLGAVAAVCLGLALSGGYSYVTLTRLQREYLTNRGNEIASLLDFRLRGPSRRNPEAWAEVFKDMLQERQDTLAFLALMDRENQVLAEAGNGDQALRGLPSGFQQSDGQRLFLLDTPVMSPQHQGQGMGNPMMGTRISGWSVRTALRASIADFIERQALVHLSVTAVAIVGLLALASYFLHVLGSYLLLQEREESARHLAAIGTMSATLAHEIRNPLGAMKGLTQLAQEELPKDHQAQALMQTVVGEAERLERLVADLLHFSRRRDPVIKQFDLIQLLQEVSDGLRSQMEAFEAELSFQAQADKLIFNSDPDGLRQVLINVLLNAAEATTAGKPGRIQLKLVRSAKQLAIVIEDEGSGIGERDPEELFQPFITSKTRGTGLGLAVSRQIVESLGGSITLARRQGTGTRCTIQLPIIP